jgi:hypothetical protein
VKPGFSHYTENWEFFHVAKYHGGARKLQAWMYLESWRRVANKYLGGRLDTHKFIKQIKD